MLIKQLIPGFYFWDGERRISSEPKMKKKIAEASWKFYIFQ